VRYICLPLPLPQFRPTSTLVWPRFGVRSCQASPCSPCGRPTDCRPTFISKSRLSVILLDQTNCRPQFAEELEGGDKQATWCRHIPRRHDG
jgi:hypothetical protein